MAFDAEDVGKPDVANLLLQHQRDATLCPITLWITLILFGRARPDLDALTRKRGAIA